MVRDGDIAYDLTDLLEVFDDLLPWTNEERGIYALRYERDDGLTIYLSFSAYERTAGASVHRGPDVSCGRVELRRCAAIRVLEKNKRTLELLAEASADQQLRCFLALDGSDILSVEEAEAR